MTKLPLLLMLLLLSSCVTMPTIQTADVDCQTEFPRIVRYAADITGCPAQSEIYYHRSDTDMPFSEVRYLECPAGYNKSVWVIAGRDKLLQAYVRDGQILSWCQMYTDDGDDLGLYWIILLGAGK